MTVASERLAPALEPGFFAPEERSLADHLALVAELARGVGFPDPAGSPGGSWAKLFEHEPAVAMAEILAYPLDRRRDAFAELAETDPAAAAEALRAAARRIELWLGRLAAAGDRRLHAVLEAVSDGAPLALVHALARGEPTPAGVLAAAGVELDGDAVARARGAMRAFLRAGERVFDAIALLRPVAGPALETRLGSGEVDPALGLLIAELRLVAEAEARIAGFTDRHTQFYFETVLGQRPRPAKPESVLLCFEPGAASVAVPAGAELVARAPGSPASQRFRLTDGLRVAPVRVAQVLALRYERDPLISPQSELGFVTRLRAGPLALDGRGGRMFAPDGAAPALGIAVASPMLFLAGGRRRIEIRLRLARRREGAAGGVAGVLASDPDLVAAFELGTLEAAVAEVARWTARLPEAGTLPVLAQVYWAMLGEAKTADQFRAVFGRIVTTVLIEGAAWPDGEYAATLRERAERLLDPDAAGVVARLVGRSRDELFQTGLGDAFALAVSSAEGRLAIKAVEVGPARDGTGIAFAFLLDEAAPPLAAPPDEAAPVVTIRTAQEARLSALSLFEPFAIEAVTIAVAVEGLAALTAFSEDGPVDTAQPFLPFGARPRDGAAFLVGAREMALKPVTEVTANLVWADLPRNAGGFAEYYRPYGEDLPAPKPALRLDYLTGEGWKALGEPVAMATAPAPDAPLRAARRLGGRVPGRPEPARLGPDAAAFRQRQHIRSGLLRMTLVAPGEGFGHAAYPGALARALRPRLVPQLERPMPPAPYTPAIAGITLDYRAEATMALDAPAAARPGERLVGFGAFGADEIFPRRSAPGAGLVPRRLADGALFVQLAGPGARGEVALAFEMAQGSHQRLAFEPRPVGWHYLTATGWQTLPGGSIGSDSTDGMMRSGLVTLDLPDDAVLASPLMPGDGAWLAITAGAHLDAFPRLAAVAANGARAERLDADGAPAGAAPRLWSLDPAVPGLGTIRQLGAPFGGALAEGERAFRTRVSERLRHRGRAVTAWDAERLVLEAFPQVWQAKCFPALDRDGRRRAGTFTLVAAPMPPDGAQGAAAARTFDVLLLRRIEAFLAERASAFAGVAVRNPSFERLQVRARVGFRSGSDDGSLARRLKLDLSRFLSVWTAAEGPLASFGWAVNLNDVGAFVAELPYVDFLTEFSILHLVADDAGRYRLHDTARALGDGRDGARALVAAEPWSLALPMRDHCIHPVRGRAALVPQATGIGGLGIGETLVVGNGGSA